MSKLFYIVDENNYFEDAYNNKREADNMQEAIRFVISVFSEDDDYGDDDNTVCIINLENMESVFITTETIKTRKVEFKIKE